MLPFRLRACHPGVIRISQEVASETRYTRGPQIIDKDTRHCAKRRECLHLGVYPSERCSKQIEN
jgi:hypothetical protein